MTEDHRTVWAVSADTHIAEPPDLFSSRLPPDIRDRGLVVKDVSGFEVWWSEGMPQIPVYLTSMAGDRFLPEEQRRLRLPTGSTSVPEVGGETEHPIARTAADMKPGINDPDVWLQDQEHDGVWASIIFPSQGLMLHSMMDTTIRRACMRAYNDYAVEWTAAHPDRLLAVALLDLDDVTWATGELRRLREAGIRGVSIPVEQPHFRRYDNPDYEQFWAAAADLDVVINFHVASNRSREFLVQRKFTSFINDPDYHVRNAITDMIVSGVFERHPGLHVVSVENEGGWAPYFLDRLDWHWKYNARFRPTRFKDGGLPSDFFRSNVFISFTEDGYLVDNHERVGASQLLWANDFPHSESTYPVSQIYLAERLAAVPDDDFAAIVGANAARLYGIDLPERRR